MILSYAEIFAAPAYGHVHVCASLPNGSVDVHSASELRHRLEQIAGEVPRPLLAEVIRTDGDLLSIGLGAPRSFLTYIPSGGDPPYFSVLDESVDDREVSFDCNGEPSFYSMRNSVPFQTALDVVCQFSEQRGLPLPTMVKWEEV